MNNSSNSYNVNKQKLDAFFRPIGSPAQRHLASNGTYTSPELSKLQNRPAEFRPYQKSLIRPTSGYAQELVTPNNSGNPIQDAINKVEARGGGRVVLSQGAYIVETQIKLPEGVSLEGIDPQNTILDFNNGTANILAEDQVGARISNLTIRNCNNTQGAIVFDVVSSGYIGNMIFRNITSSAIRLEDCTLISVEDVDGLDLSLEEPGAGTIVSIIDCILVDIRNVATFSQRGIVSSGDLGLVISHVDNCELIANSDAISGVFSLCTFTACYTQGATAVRLLTDSDSDSDDNTFQACIMNGIGRGLSVTNGDLNKFVGNTIIGTDEDAVTLTNADDNTFSGNRITGNGAGNFSINIGTACDRTVVVGNNLETLGTAADPIQDNGTNTVYGTAFNAI